jgi:hypothetical protein
VNRCVQASQARFDLSACDFQRHKGFSLNGEWQFRWQQLANRGLAEPTALIKVPSQWYNAYSLFAEQYPAQGYATYRTEVLLPTEQVGQPLALRVNSARVASRILVDGMPIGESGQPAATRAEEVPKNKPYTAPFQAEQTRITIDVEVSNFHNGASAGLNFSVRNTASTAPF